MHNTRRSLASTLTTLALVLGAVAARADGPPPEQVPLRPFLSCVESLPRARVRAHWGYLNSTKTALTRALGPQNRATGQPDAAQPTQFAPGFALHAWSTLFDAAHSSSWTLDGITVTADARSHACGPGELTTRAQELTNPAPGSALFVGANFWSMRWQGMQEYFAAGASFAAGSNPWQPQLLRELAPYSVLRFMDWNLTNDATNPQSHWATRRPQGQAQREPIAYEWQIDLCNRTQKDYWVNVPHLANEAYFAQLAQLIHAQLDPHLRVYVEWSNEVWNGSFPQHAYARAQGAQLALPGADPAMAYQVLQSVRLFEAFARVFGKGSPRVVNVLAGQAAYAGPCRAQLDALAHDELNPHHLKPDVYAIAPYVRGTTLAELRGAGLTEAKQWVAESLACAQRAGLPLIAYEGGQDSFELGVAQCEQLQRDPGMRALYTTLLDALADAGLRGPFVHYTHSGPCWGLKVHTGDETSAAPKYQGLVDWLNRSPPKPAR